MKLSELRKKMSDWDFSEHTHRVEIFKSDKGNEVRIDHLQKGNSMMGYVRFVNDDFGLSVFGDFGNWIFCRPFVPSKEGFVSAGYWNEKLKIASCQDHAKFDGDETEKELRELIKEISENKEDYNDPDRLIEFYTDLIDYTEDEIEYIYHAFRYSMPSSLDYDDIPFAKKGSYQLRIVFDAFNEICNRL
jgi:hypothetical protein